MRISFAIMLAVSVLTVSPALAGTLTFDGGQTAWHSTQCTKPSTPPSLLAAHPETAGDDMNGLMSLHNAFADAAQNYMNCISNEAEHDQGAVAKAITANAQKAIADMQDEVNTDAQMVRGKQN